jgi:hypothetical protein
MHRLSCHHSTQYVPDWGTTLRDLVRNRLSTRLGQGQPSAAVTPDLTGPMTTVFNPVA